MKSYLANAVITLPAGSVVEISERQAADRGARLKRVAPGRYELKEALQFKAGERFGYDGDLPKAVALAVEATAPEKKAAEPDKKGAPAKAKSGK